MSVDLGLSRPFLLGLANSASHHYKTYSIPKRNGGSRQIHHPSKVLKPVQRWLLRNVVALFPTHRCARAYFPGATTVNNALSHKNSKYLLRMDLVDFFHSICVDDVTAFLLARRGVLPPGWGNEDDAIFAALVCRQGGLTIGAPTSPQLSNAMCFELDERLDALAVVHGVVYTRYADDLFFSTRQPNVLRVLEAKIAAVCESVEVPGHLRVNAEKTRRSSMRGARRVTGIVLGSDGEVHAGRALKRKIRALVHRHERLSPAEQRHLAGLVSYVVSVEKSFLNDLIQKYGPDRIEKVRKPPPP